MQQPTHKQKAPINITETRHFSESCHIYLIQYLDISTKVSTFFSILVKKLKIQYAGPLVRARGAGTFFKYKRGAAYSGPKSSIYAEFSEVPPTPPCKKNTTLPQISIHCFFKVKLFTNVFLHSLCIFPLHSLW